MALTPHTATPHSHLDGDHDGHSHRAPAPVFSGTALVLGAGTRITLACGAAILLWITVGWALA